MTLAYCKTEIILVKIGKVISSVSASSEVLIPLAEPGLPFHASQNIYNLVISQQNRRCAYNSYGWFHSVSETRSIRTINQRKA